MAMRTTKPSGHQVTITWVTALSYFFSIRLIPMDSDRKRLLILLPIERLVSVVDSSDTLFELSKKYSVTLLGRKFAKLPEAYQSRSFQERSLGRYTREILLNVNTIRKITQVKSFETRVLKTMGVGIQELVNLRQKKFLLLGYLLKPRTFFSILISLTKEQGILERTIIRCSFYWPSLNRALAKVRPEVVLIFSGGAFSGVENILLGKSRRLGIKTALVIDNWDNLSSKSLFTSSPNALGVWGPNMHRDALEIHSMSPRIVSHVGSARFRPNERPSPQSRPAFVLFAGSGKPLFNELTALIDLRLMLDRKQLSTLNIIYRPHPMSRVNQNSIVDVIEKLERVELDSSFSGPLESNFYKSEPLEELENLCRLATFIIAPLSSIIVEGLSLGTPVVSLNWTRNPNADLPLSEYTHFLELREVRGFFPVTSWEELESQLTDVIACKGEKNLVPEILPSFNTRYADRVVSLVEELMDSEKSN